MPSNTEQPQTFSAFEGKLSGNSIKGVSLLQKGPALGHGVWVDDTTLSQAKKSAASIGKLKAKQNHWSGIEDTIGYYENFRVKDEKLVADLTLFDAAPGTPLLLQMIDSIPGTFGVSISFGRDEHEYDEKLDRYNARVRELYSADFVDTPAANRDGVFQVIDRNTKDMSAITPEAFEAYKAEQATELAELKEALHELMGSNIKQLKAELAALQAQTPPAPEPAKEDPNAALTAKIEELASHIKALAAAPPAGNASAPANEPEATGDDPLVKTQAQFKALPHADRNAFFAAGGKLKD